jgi:uncharacterized protein (DUF58 family)
VLTTEEIIKKVKALEIKSKKITTHLFMGEYHAAFKGKGMNFREVREYTAGDDVRFIDWNVSARFNHPFTKVFEEERELTIFLLIDISASNLFGTATDSKKNILTAIAALLTFSAINDNNKVGIIFFSDKIEQYIAPQKSRKHALYIVRQLLTITPTGTSTNFETALKYFNNVIKQKSILFLLSDFVGTTYQKDIKVIANKHDVIGIKIYDKMDMELPDIGLLAVQDIETGHTQFVNTSDRMVQYNYKTAFLQAADDCSNCFKKGGANLLHISTSDDYVKILQQFFITRR